MGAARSGYNGEMNESEQIKRLQEQVREDRKLIQKAADTLGEIHRGPGLSDEHADVLAALRIRLEGKKRASLEELLTATGDVGKKDLGDALGGADSGSKSDWPAVEEKKKDWPGT
jgi:hypothetical protein